MLQFSDMGQDVLLGTIGELSYNDRSNASVNKTDVSGSR
jgi:hypothetical protein